ncbi:TIGR00341 family protein [Candidatus Woesebacteria bacterium]|nr:TIGR00341 family protein [Candidatus Woesebacteria bacterium]
MQIPSPIHIDHDIKKVQKATLAKEIDENASLSQTYIILLVVSAVICTLGLILNSTPIVIGGMIIAPLMWPIMKVSVGITAGSKKDISDAIIIFLASVGITLLSSYLIAMLSPIKSLNAEILARAQPTVLDLCIALSAGVVAALGLVEKKVSSMLAGVAIATSLMPPLCVAGIGFALQSSTTAWGSLLLFIANVLSIIFISILIFRFSGLNRAQDPTLRRNGLIFVAAMLLVTSFPLLFFLNRYSFKSAAYKDAQSILESSLKEISEDIYVQNLSTELMTDTEKPTVVVNADVLIPENVVLDFAQRDAIIKKLQETLQRDVKLNLRIQNTIALQTEQDKQTQFITDLLKQAFTSEIQQYDSSLSIDDVMVSPGKGDSWQVDAVLRGDPLLQFSEIQRNEIEHNLSAVVGSEVRLNLEIISRIRLKAEEDVQKEELKQLVLAFFEDISPDIDLNALQVSNDVEQSTLRVRIVAYIPSNITMSQSQVDQLKLLLQQKFSEKLVLSFTTVEKHEYVSD